MLFVLQMDRAWYRAGDYATQITLTSVPADKGQTGALYFMANENDLVYGLKQSWTSQSSAEIFISSS
jgi:hypothetical protein